MENIFLLENLEGVNATLAKIEGSVGLEGAAMRDVNTILATRAWSVLAGSLEDLIFGT